MKALQRQSFRGRHRRAIAAGTTSDRRLGYRYGSGWIGASGLLGRLHRPMVVAAQENDFERWHNDQQHNWTDEHSADNDGSEGSLNFAADPGGDRRGQEADACRKTRHE